jgi:YidC/Oxa1 family membrane protein insertase
MTLTDLDSFYLKRSENPVHYFYVFHSLISIHAAYNKQAFLAYDSIFCTGPHHVAELKKQRQLLGLPENHLIEGGYCRLDEIVRQAKQTKSDAEQARSSDKPTVLVSPTWGEASLVGKGLETVIEKLTAAEIHTILRLHPMTIRQQPGLTLRLRDKFADNEFFIYDGDAQATKSLQAADIMIADHGGSAIEFALGLERPVIFIETPAKVHNHDYKELGLPLFEREIRAQAGKALQLSELHKVCEVAVDMHQQKDKWRNKLANLKRERIFNNEKSARVMAGHLNAFING